MRDLVAGSNCVSIPCWCMGSSHDEGRVRWGGGGAAEDEGGGERENY